MKQWMTWALSAYLLTVYLPVTVSGQDTSQEDESTTQVTTESEMNEETSNQTQTEESSQDMSISVDHKDYTPYGKFVNYQYQGDGSFFQVQDIIMEYPPNSDGLFQITSFAGDQAIAHVYQIGDEGVYELAYFENYTTVEDMRYSPDALNPKKSLIIPKDPKIGKTYQTGYNQENKRTIVDILEQFELGGITFSNVLKIHEEDSLEQQDYHYYYAPDYGLILIQHVQQDGSERNIVQLISTQGDVIEN